MDTFYGLIKNTALFFYKFLGTSSVVHGMLNN